ncbi:diguanylate cyclase [Sphingomonas sp. ZT3P38]|uniref:GGDEF domain-containing protein n=1 Tax=Parasphingomonas zepuensis TaxID=3096161 RepID=UPI002FC5AC41
MYKGWIFTVSALIGAFILLALIGAKPAMAQTGLAGTPVDVCIARATPGIDAHAVFAGQGRFNCVTSQTALGPGEYWALSAPVHATGPVDIRIGSLWQERVTLYALYADGTILSAVTDGRAATRHLQLGAIIQRSFPARDAPLVRLLWHVEGSANLRGILIGPRIATPEESTSANLLLGAIYAAFAGLCIALLIHNLALWGALRHPFQLAYCGMLLALLVYTASSSGALAWAWPDMANNDRLRVNYASLGMAAVAAMLFARTFFEPRVFAGWLAKTSNVVCGLMVITVAMLATLKPSHVPLFDLFFCLVFAAQLGIVVPILWRGWRMRSNYLWMFAIAWAAPIVLACFRAAGSFGALDWSFWLDNSTILAMTVEALFSSLAIAYRIRLLSLERDEAREQEIAARLLADTDPLTGLFNRRAFLRHAIGREGDQILLVADIDHFKRVNEAIGHDGGDEVLRVFARTLRQSVPPEALVARIGGEEFAIVTPVTLAVEPEDILARLREARMPFGLSVTASIGSCTGRLTKEGDWKALYRCADRALFEAKAAGRDRVHGAVPESRIVA